MMANEKNLIPNSKRTPKELREIAKKGGKKSVEVRRKRKAMKEQMEMLLTLPLKNTKLKKQLQEIGINEKEIDNQMALIVSLYQTALRGGTNSVQAFNTIMEIVNEKQNKDNDIQSLSEAIQKAYDKKAGDK